MYKFTQWHCTDLSKWKCFLIQVFHHVFLSEQKCGISDHGIINLMVTYTTLLAFFGFRPHPFYCLKGSGQGWALSVHGV